MTKDIGKQVFNVQLVENIFFGLILPTSGQTQLRQQKRN